MHSTSCWPFVTGENNPYLSPLQNMKSDVLAQLYPTSQFHKFLKVYFLRAQDLAKVRRVWGECAVLSCSLLSAIILCEEVRLGCKIRIVLIISVL